MPLTPGATKIIEDYGKQPGVSADNVQNLKTAIERSPALVDEINQATAGPHPSVTKFTLLPAGAHASAQYDPDSKAVQVPLIAVTTPKPGDSRADFDSLTNTLGHEVQHSLNAKHMEDVRATLQKEADTVASSPKHDHDYTAPIDKLTKEYLRDEASGQLSGWNADVSAARKAAADAKQPTPTLRDLYRLNPSDAENFIDIDRSGKEAVYKLKPNLVANPDLTLPLNDQNVKGVTENILTRPDIGIGAKGTSEYRNFYGAYAMSVAAQAERQHEASNPGKVHSEMSVNLNQLGLKPKILAENGIDLGSDKSAMRYMDKSSDPPTQRWLQDTSATHTYTVNPKKPEAQPGFEDPTHPGHELFKQAQGHVHALDAQLGRAPDARSDNLAGAVTVAALAASMTRIDHVLPDIKGGSTMFVAQNTSPLTTNAEVPTVQAMNTPLEQSSAQYMQMSQQKAQAQAQQPVQTQDQTQQQAGAQQQAQPRPAGP